MYIDYMHFYSDFTAVTEHGNNIDKTVCTPMKVAQNNSFVTIQFENVLSGLVTFNVFSPHGQKIPVFTDVYFPAGQQKATWNTGTGASGVYLFELETGGAKETGSFRLLK